MPLQKLCLFFCLSLADLALTWHLVGQGNGRVYEGNPVARWWLLNYGWGGLALFKLALAVIVGALIAVIARRRPSVARTALSISCGILAVVVLYSCFLVGTAVAHPSFGSSEVEDPDLAPVVEKSQQLNRLLAQATAYHDLLERLSADLVARRRTLREAVELLAQTDQGNSPLWLKTLRRAYPGRSDRACLAANLVYNSLFLLQGGTSVDEEIIRRLAADYRSCYGLSFKLPADLVDRPACWRFLDDIEG
jgi:hypothetical protein